MRTMPSMRAISIMLFASFLAVTATLPVAAEQEPNFTLVIRNHRFEPAEITVPASRRIKLTIRNLDSTPEEFESYELNREKIVSGGGTITIYIGPLRAGIYPFFGEFHQKTARGRVIAK